MKIGYVRGLPRGGQNEDRLPSKSRSLAIVIDNDCGRGHGTIFAFGFSKKYDLSLILIEGRVLDRCRAFDQLVSVDAHLWCAMHEG
jgi:hypothetical protein